MAGGPRAKANHSPIGQYGGRDTSQEMIGPKKKFQFEDFQYIKDLGHGSFGKVKLVKHKKSNKLFALKCISKDSIKGKKQIQHIINEKYIL